MDLSFAQSQKMTQEQVLSQRQIQALNMLLKPSADLREAIYQEAERNPALEIEYDLGGTGGDIRLKRGSYELTRDVSKNSVSRSAMEKSDNFQAVLEAQEDTRQSLQEHLTSQVNMMNLSPAELAVTQRLISNLDEHGFNVLAPVSLLEADKPEQTAQVLEKSVSLIQKLDPIGCCVNNEQESLAVQAKIRGDAPDLALFLLDGHLDFLYPPSVEKAIRKISAYQKNLGKMFALSKKEEAYAQLQVDSGTVQEALDYIRTLDPYPARDYTSTQTAFIAPEIFVEQLTLPPGVEAVDSTNRGLVESGGLQYQIRSVRGTIPKVQVRHNFLSKGMKQKHSLSTEEQKFVDKAVSQAEEFVSSLEFRTSTIEATARAIVKAQGAFFAKGPGHLVPLKQQQVAQELGVHESTVSRSVNGKYLMCSWGLFEMKYFFAGAVGGHAANAVPLTQGAGGVSGDVPLAQIPAAVTSAVSLAQPQAPLTSAASLTNTVPPAPNTAQLTPTAVLTKEAILLAIKKIIDDHQSDTKKMSDQKICTLLAAQGITVARRTVAKYRAQLNIDSSYTR